MKIFIPYNKTKINFNLYLHFYYKIMTMRDDKLKSLLSSKMPKPQSGPEEVKLSGNISPVASIKVVGVG
jgi:hypothetical protein